MLLRRIGNKAKIAKDIIKYFPKHDIFIDMFFGAGGLFFNKPVVKYNFLNDIDGNIINLFNVLMKQKEELIDYLEMTPYSCDFFAMAKTRTPDNDIEKAVYFLVLSNWSYMGSGDIVSLRAFNNSRILTISNAKITYKNLIGHGNNSFLNCDFREVLNQISYKPARPNEKNTSFIYADKPYSSTRDNYDYSWTDKDDVDLLEVLLNSGIKFAASEFQGSNFESLAKDAGLNIITIGERRTMKSRNTEILITNYKNEIELFN